MLAKLVDKPFDKEGWIFEIKWDGFRAIAEIKKGKVEMYSRNNLSFNERFEPVVKELQKNKKDMILDGEVVALDTDGRSRFQLLQNYMRTGKGRLVYHVFDILELNGQDLKDLPLIQRKKVLKKELLKSTHVKYSDHIVEQGIPFFEEAVKHKLEGIIAKDDQSPYRCGVRNNEWLKIKTHLRQEAVIGGFTEPRGGRKKFGALVLGVYHRGKLEYIGHTGGGFDQATLKLVYDKLKPFITKKSPFEKPPKTNAPVTWVKPKLICEVEFSEWTTDGSMRQPIFVGLRTDKPASKVIRELPVGTPIQNGQRNNY